MSIRQVLRLGLGACALLIGTEALLRFGVGLGDPPLVHLDDTVEYQLVPDRRYHRYGNLIAINAHGLRSSDIPEVRTPQDRRILLIGDSVIYGNHFLDQSETIAFQMQAYLSKSDKLRRCTSLVIAAAVSSWGPVNQAAFLKQSGLFQADQGLLVVSAHDLYDTPHFGSVLPYRTSAPFGALDDARQILVERFGRKTIRSPQDPVVLRRKHSLEALDQIAAYFAQENIPLTLVYHPTTPEQNGRAQNERDIFAHWATGHGLDVLDLSTAPLNGQLYRDTIHPNADGARSLAKRFANHTAERLSPCS